MTTRTAFGMLAAALTTVALAGCGGAAAPSAAPEPAASAVYAEADVTFVQGMIPHHAQAVAMAELAADRASSPQVTRLAAQIAGAQGPEIEQMHGLLSAWGPHASGHASHTGSMDMSGVKGMSGMMSDQQMQQLGAATGAAFDRMFLQMMVQHHTGAIEMAGTELRDGQNPDAKTLAQEIIDAQRAEITTMQQLLATG
jgi:uncharacterized protein (DUF305 family)